MTSSYTPSALPGYLPYLEGGPLDNTVIDPPAPWHFRTFRLPANDQDTIAYGRDGVIGWELKIDDLRGGYMQSGDFARGANPLDGDYRCTSESTADTRYRRHLMLPAKAIEQQLGAGGSDIASAYFTHVGTTLHFGMPLTVANGTVWWETTAGAWNAIAYTPASALNGLSSIVIGGVSNPERLLALLLSTPPAVGPTDGVMHANLTPCFGHIMSPINATTPGTGTNLFYANNGIWALPLSAAIGAAPVQTLSNVPNGGYAVGVEKLPKGNWGLRAFWVWPQANTTTPVLVSLNPLQAGVMSTNLEGTDPLPVPLPLTKVRRACFWRRNLVTADETRIVAFDGENARDLRILANRPPWNGKYQIEQLIVNDNELYAVLLRYAPGPGGVGISPRNVWVEQYLPEFDSWVTATSFLPDTGAMGSDPIMPAYGNPVRATAVCRNIPYSRSTGNVYIPAIRRGQLASYLMSPAAVNPYYLYQQVGNGLTEGKRRWEDNCLWYSPYWELPNLEGRWKRVDEVIFMGDVDNANADCRVSVYVGGLETGAGVRFAPGLPHVAQIGETGEQGLFMQLRLTILIERGFASEFKTPNALPLMLRGRAYLTNAEQNVLGIPPGP